MVSTDRDENVSTDIDRAVAAAHCISGFSAAARCTELLHCDTQSADRETKFIGAEPHAAADTGA